MNSLETRHEIDLSPEKEVRILSGKIPGMRARELYGLDQLDSTSGRVVVKIGVPVVTSSFILGMFSDSVRRLGVDGFFAKYDFEASEAVIDNIRVNARYSAEDATALTA